MAGDGAFDVHGHILSWRDGIKRWHRKFGGHYTAGGQAMTDMPQYRLERAGGLALRRRFVISVLESVL
ncbi:hypothetical protein BA190_23005 [Labrys sp. WJW]|nr:hypothetical protein BA190_23005 [Labrys sp. WJW]